MPMRLLTDYLMQENIQYIATNHPPSYTAMETAQSAHVPGKELIKTVIVNMDGMLAMAILPATEELDLERLKQLAQARSISLAKEEEFSDRFPLCETGGMPPFGNLFGMDVYCDPCWDEDETIAFNAGSHTEIVMMCFGDYIKTVKPILGTIRRLH